MGCPNDALTCYDTQSWIFEMSFQMLGSNLCFAKNRDFYLVIFLKITAKVGLDTQKMEA